MFSTSSAVLVHLIACRQTCSCLVLGWALRHGQTLVSIHAPSLHFTPMNPCILSICFVRDGNMNGHPLLLSLLLRLTHSRYDNSFIDSFIHTLGYCCYRCGHLLIDASKAVRARKRIRKRNR
eukprot:GHVU01064565.1.p2 GENE.GHVU01064565.1~~GHVU01064565.1.p2  ORF type:complete len:122 (+),score=1.27 GHVU01064565.1:262-627(+)